MKKAAPKAQPQPHTAPTRPGPLPSSKSNEKAEKAKGPTPLKR